MNTEVMDAARRAVEDQPRHDSETLFELLCKWFPLETHPEVTDEDIWDAVNNAF